MPEIGDFVLGAVALVADDINQELRSRIEVFPEGDFLHHQAGKMRVTAEHLQELADDVNERGDKIPLDFDHSFGKGQGSLAAGWFVRGSASLEPSTADASKTSLWADVQWTPRAAESIRSGEYRFISPEWNFRWKDNSGKVHQKPRLFAAALTNRPFFEQMGPVALCDAGLDELIEDDNTRAARPKEGEMPLKAIAESLGLAADATEEQIAAAIKETNEKTSGLEAEVVELKKTDSKPEGIETTEAFKTLAANAAAGAEAARTMEKERMNRVIDDAIKARKIDPAQRGMYETLYAADSAEVVKLFDSLKEGSWGPIGSAAGGEGTRSNETVAASSGHHALYGSNPPTEILVNSVPMDVDPQSRDLHVEALKTLEAAGKALTYTADEYFAAIELAADKQGIAA